MVRELWIPSSRDEHEEVTRSYDYAFLRRAAASILRAERATIPDFEEEVTDEALIVEEREPAFTFVKRTSVLDAADFERASARLAQALHDSFTPTTRQVVPVMLCAPADLPTGPAPQKTQLLHTAIALTISAAIGVALSYAVHVAPHLGSHAIEWLRYAMSI